MIKVREKISDKTVVYPASELVPLIGHVGNEQYYEISEAVKPTYDYRTHKLERIEKYSTAKGVLLPLWKVTYKLTQLSNDEIKANVESELGSYLDETYPLWERIKHTSIGSEAMLAMIQGVPYDADKLAYVQGQLAWVTNCRLEAKSMIEELYLNGTLPLFNFSIRP